MDEGRIELPASSLRTKHSATELLARMSAKLDLMDGYGVGGI